MFTFNLSASSLIAQDNQGAVWNFPATKKGYIKTKLKINSNIENLDLVLNDRWFNPTDTDAKYEDTYTLPLSRKQLDINDNK